MKKAIIRLLGFGAILTLAACGTGNQDENLSTNDGQAYAPAISAAAKAPDTIISATDRPPDPSYSSTAKFKFSCTTPLCTFKCALDTTHFSKCKSPKTYQNLPDGAHTFAVKATAKANGKTDPTPDQYGWSCQSNFWQATSTTNAPVGRREFSAVWTGSKMIVWGGNDVSAAVNTGGVYDPVGDSWTPTSTTNAPSARYAHSAVWTDSKMIIWGGTGGSVFGGIYDPNLDSWTQTSFVNAPENRSYHIAVWTGSKMIVWGGIGGTYLNTGGIYDPDTNFWTATSIAHAPSGRENPVGVWTGTRMIVWGGYSSEGITEYWYNTGGRYNPGNDSWAPTSTSRAPAGRTYTTAVWTGTEMIIWGGGISSTRLNTGGRYNPSSNSWVATSTVNAPSAREYHSAVWTTGVPAPVMIVWGDINYSNTGGKYDPANNSWTATSTTNAPTGRMLACAIWTGSNMIVWGGAQGFVPAPFNTGGIYWP